MHFIFIAAAATNVGKNSPASSSDLILQLPDLLGRLLLCRFRQEPDKTAQLLIWVKNPDLELFPDCSGKTARTIDSCPNVLRVLKNLQIMFCG